MFAPEGYVPFSKLYQLGLTQLEFDGELFKYLRNRPTNFVSLIRGRGVDILNHWLMELCGEELFLSDGKCNPIMIDPLLIETDHLYLDIIHRESREDMLKIPDDLIIKFNIAEPISHDDINNYLERVGLLLKEGLSDDLINSDNEIKKIINYYLDPYGGGSFLSGRAHPLIFVTDSSYVINFELYNHLITLDEKIKDDIFAENADDRARMLSKFEGMALCVPKKFIDKNWDRFWYNISDRKKTDFNYNEREKYSKGRPSVQHKTRILYNKLFPDGNHGSWKEAIRKLEGHGLRISISTLKRAISRET